MTNCFDFNWQLTFHWNPPNCPKHYFIIRSCFTCIILQLWTESTSSNQSSVIDKVNTMSTRLVLIILLFAIVVSNSCVRKAKNWIPGPRDSIFSLFPFAFAGAKRGLSSPLALKERVQRIIKLEETLLMIYRCKTVMHNSRTTSKNFPVHRFGSDGQE